MLQTCVAFALLMMANGIWQTLAGGDYYAVYWRSDVRGASILCGAIAYLGRSAITPKGVLAGICPVVLGLIALALNTNPVPDYMKYTAGTALLAGALATLPAALPMVLRVLELPLFRWFGLASFSLYLWQQPFYVLWKHAELDRATALASLGVVGLLSYALVEKAGRSRLSAWLATYRPKVNAT